MKWTLDAVCKNPDLARRHGMKLKAENDALREALETVRAVTNMPDAQILNDAERVRRIRVVADSALRRERPPVE
jgi:hypothetical protein